MIKNKKGQATLGIAIVIAIIVFLMGMPVVNILKGEVNTARGSTGLDCSNASITDGTRLTCLGVDLVIPYFMLIVISIAIGLITARFLI